MNYFNQRENTSSVIYTKNDKFVTSESLTKLQQSLINILDAIVIYN